MKYFQDSDLVGLLEAYRDARVELQSMFTGLKDMEKYIKKLVMETGEVAEVDGCAVSIRDGYTRTSWDGRALQGYAVAHPEIEQFRKQSEVKASAVIKVKL